MKNQENELSVLLPETEIKVGDKVLTIQPFPFSKLTKVIGLFSKIGISFYGVAQSIHIDAEKNTVKITGDAIAATAALFQQHFDDVVDLIAIYCREDRAVFKGDDFTVNDALKIILAIITLHKSFFTQTVSPAIREMTGLPGQK